MSVSLKILANDSTVFNHIGPLFDPHFFYVIHDFYPDLENYPQPIRV